MIKLPIGNKWSQLNKSDRFGSLWATKNVNLDETGYLKLSPRAVKLLDEETNAALGLAVAIGRFGQGEFQVATSSNANFVVGINAGALAVTEDTGTLDPTLTADSSGVFWQDRWHASTATAVLSKAANGAANATWTSRITGLTSGVNHALELFDSRNQLCVANGNVVKQYNTSYSGTTDLTIPSDFEIVALAYNNGKMGVGTQAGLNTTGQLLEAKFYVWDGSTTSATGWGVGATKILAVFAYQSTWAVLTNTGRLKIFNGNGFTDDSVQYPYYAENKWLAPVVQTGNPMAVDGDRILVNLGLRLTPFGTNEQEQIPNLPSGIWCLDPKVGFYHRYSASNSQVYLVSANASGANASTNVITAASGTLPATGNPIRLIDGAPIGNISKNTVYFIIKLSSSTFSLASTRELALAGVAIDITATNSDSTRFHAFDIVDFGVTFRNDMAALALFGETSNLFTDVIFGADVPTIAALAANDVLCMTVPGLENRGWLISPKIFSEGAQDLAQSVYVKFRPLKDTDAIVVKLKDRDVVGLPVSAPSASDTDNGELIWTGVRSGYTTANLTAALACLEAGGELEIEFTAGAGAGQTVQIETIEEDNGIFSLTFAEDVTGALSTRESYFIIDAWELKGTITSEDNIEGFREVNLGSPRKFAQVKIELRGVEVAIEELVIDNATDI